MKGHVRRRGPDRYEIAIYQYRIGNRRVYYYETFHGTRRQADARCAELVIAREHNRLADRAELTVAQLADEWFDAIRDDRAPNTLRNYRSLLDTHIVPLLGRHRLRKLDVVTLERTYRMLRRGETPTGRALSVGSLRNVHAVVSGMCALAHRYGWIPDNPARHVRLPAEATSDGFVLPDVTDVCRLAADVGARDPDREAFVYCALGTGARRGELCGLQWADIDFEAATVTIARTVTRTLDTAAWMTKVPKGGKARRLALDDDLVAVLRALQARSLDRALAAGIALPANAFCFTPAVDGSRPWSPEYVTHWWGRACRARGLHIRFHDLRHLHASDMAEVAQIAVVKERLGHSQLKTTNRYTHVRDDADRAAVQRLAARRTRARE